MGPAPKLLQEPRRRGKGVRMDRAIVLTWGTRADFGGWLLTNFGLALLPVFLALLIGKLVRGARRRGKPPRWVLLGPLLVLWLLFLPNTCYLFTDLRHAAQAIDENNLYLRAPGDREAREGLIFWGVVVGLGLVGGAASFFLPLCAVLRLLPEGRCALPRAVRSRTATVRTVPVRAVLFCLFFRTALG